MNSKPWETPRVARIIELFNGKPVEIKKIVVRRNSENAVQR